MKNGSEQKMKNEKQYNLGKNLKKGNKFWEKNMRKKSEKKTHNTGSPPTTTKILN